MHFYNHSKKQLILIISVLLIYFIFIFIIYDNIKNQEKELLHSRLVKYSMIATRKISDYIGPIQNLASYTTDIMDLCKTSLTDVHPLSNSLFYLLKNYKQFSAIFVVSDKGDGYGMERLKSDSLVFISIEKNIPLSDVIVHKLINGQDGSYNIASVKSFKTKIKMSERPWVKTTVNENKIYCTNFYKFYYSNERGLTLSKKYVPKPGGKDYKYIIVGFDILAKDVLKFLGKIKETISGDIFFLDDSLRVIPSLCHADTLINKTGLYREVVRDNLALYDSASVEYLKLAQPKDPFEFRAFEHKWIVYIRKIDLSNNASLYLGVVLPNYLSQMMFRTKMILLASIILILLFIFYLVYSILEKQKQNILLIKKNMALANSSYLLLKPEKTRGSNKLVSDSNPVGPDVNQVNSDPAALNSRTTVRILDELERLTSEKFYLSKDATLYNISKTLGTNTSYLSKVINSYKGKNYPDFLNELRINEAIMRIIEGDVLKKYSLEGFAHELGFKSKSSFNNAFKKYTGVTPSEFIASIKGNK